MSRAALFSKPRLLGQLQSASVTLLAPALGGKDSRCVPFLGEYFDVYLEIRLDLGLPPSVAPSIDELPLEERAWLMFLRSCSYSVGWKEDETSAFNLICDSQSKHSFVFGTESEVPPPWSRVSPSELLLFETAGGHRGARLPDGTVYVRLVVEANVRPEFVGRRVFLAAEVAASREPDVSDTVTLLADVRRAGTERAVRSVVRAVEVAPPPQLSSTSAASGTGTLLMVTVRNVGALPMTVLRAHVLPSSISTAWLDLGPATAWDIAAVADDLPSVLRPGDARMLVFRVRARAAAEAGGEAKAWVAVAWRASGMGGAVVSRVRVRWAVPGAGGLFVALTAPTPLVCGVDGDVQLTVVNNTATAHCLTLTADAAASADLVLADPVVPLGCVAARATRSAHARALTVLRSDVPAGTAAAVQLRMRPLRGGTVLLGGLCLSAPTLASPVRPPPIALSVSGAEA